MIPSLIFFDQLNCSYQLLVNIQFCLNVLTEVFKLIGRESGWRRLTVNNGSPSFYCRNSDLGGDILLQIWVNHRVEQFQDYLRIGMSIQDLKIHFLCISDSNLILIDFRKNRFSGDDFLICLLTWVKIGIEQ